jgi:hypothetical protein
MSIKRRLEKLVATRRPALIIQRVDAGVPRYSQEEIEAKITEARARGCLPRLLVIRTVRP